MTKLPYGENRMFRALKVLSCAVALMAFGILAASCGSGNAQYRLVNAIPISSQYGTGGFDIYMNGSSTGWTSVAFTFTEPSSAGKYQSVGAGSDTLEVYPAGEAGLAGDQVITSALNFSGGSQYTAVLTGNSTSGTYPLAAQRYSDNNSQIPSSGNALFRVIDASLTTGALDVYILPPGTYPYSNPHPSPTVTGLSFPNASSYNNVGLPTSNTLDVYVTASGSTNPISQVPVGNLAGGKSIRTIVVVDANGGGTIGSTPMIEADIN